MTTSPENRNPIAGQATGLSGEPTQQQGKSIGRYLNTTQLQEHQAAAVVSSVRSARTHLLHAVYQLDDAGHHCQRLDDLQADTAGLLCEWAGRRWPNIEPELPAYVSTAAREWRRSTGRTY